MKKHFTILFILNFILFSVSCTKQSEVQDPITQLDEETKQAIHIGNTAEIKQAYVLLNPNQKQRLWEVKLAAILKNDEKRLTFNQKSIILSLQGVLLNTRIENLIINSKWADSLIKTNMNFYKQNFDVYQLFLLIECPYFCESFSIFNAKSYFDVIDENKNKYSDIMIKPLVAFNPDCNCKYDIYCSRQGDKTVCMDGDQNCREVTGCGLFGTSNCTGRGQ